MKKISIACLIAAPFIILTGCSPAGVQSVVDAAKAASSVTPGALASSLASANPTAIIPSGTLPSATVPTVTSSSAPTTTVAPSADMKTFLKATVTIKGKTLEYFGGKYSMPALKTDKKGRSFITMRLEQPGLNSTNGGLDVALNFDVYVNPTPGSVTGEDTSSQLGMAATEESVKRAMNQTPAEISGEEIRQYFNFTERVNGVTMETMAANFPALDAARHEMAKWTITTTKFEKPTTTLYPMFEATFTGTTKRGDAVTGTVSLGKP